MAVNIKATENLTNGPYQVPSEVDNGKKYTKIVEKFMARMAVHKHDNVDGLPQSQTKSTFDAKTVVVTTEELISWQADTASAGYKADIDLGTPVANSFFAFFVNDDAADKTEDDVGYDITTAVGHVMFTHARGSTANHLQIKSNKQFKHITIWMI